MYSLYSYCGHNPLNRYDHRGERPHYGGLSKEEQEALARPTLHNLRLRRAIEWREEAIIANNNPDRVAMLSEHVQQIHDEEAFRRADIYRGSPLENAILEVNKANVFLVDLIIGTNYELQSQLTIEIDHDKTYEAGASFKSDIYGDHFGIKNLENSLRAQHGYEMIYTVAEVASLAINAAQIGKYAIKGGRKLVQRLSRKADDIADAPRALRVVDDFVDAVAPAKRSSGTTVLGSYPEYSNLANAHGYRYFDIPMEHWRKLASSQAWEANRKFLDRTIRRGDRIILSSDPRQVAKKGAYFRREAAYLMWKGYRIVNRSGILEMVK